MAKKDSGVFWKAATIVLVVLLVYMVVNPGTSYKSILKPSISNAYHSQIDVVSPEYLDVRAVDCAAHSGDWFDQKDRLGCFDIEIPWDTTTCTTTQIDLLQSVCSGLSATWVCTTNDVGCYY